MFHKWRSMDEQEWKVTFQSIGGKKTIKANESYGKQITKSITTRVVVILIH